MGMCECVRVCLKLAGVFTASDRESTTLSLRHKLDRVFVLKMIEVEKIFIIRSFVHLFVRLFAFFFHLYFTYRKGKTKDSKEARRGRGGGGRIGGGGGRDREREKERGRQEYFVRDGNFIKVLQKSV